jgi:hypothetical protein
VRLQKVHRGHKFGDKLFLALMNIVAGHAPGVVRTLRYRKEYFGTPWTDLTQHVMRGPSEWSVGEREIFAAFVSHLNHCVF